MKILWHMPTFDPIACGLTRRALGLAQSAAAHGHSITFAVTADRTRITAESVSGFPLVRISCPREKPVHWSFQSLRKKKQASYLVDVLTNSNPQLFLSCQPEVVAELGSRRDRCPVVYVCGGTTLLHEFLDREERKRHPTWRQGGYLLDACLKRSNERAAFRVANRVITDSESTRTLVARHYSLDTNRIVAIPGGIDVDCFRPPTAAQRHQARERLGLSKTDAVVAWTGRLSREKNLPLLLRAIKRCRSEPILLVVGDGPDRADLELLKHQLELGGRVRFPGVTSDVSPFLHAADIFCFPSLAESFGLSLIEAMASGLPCIALRSDGRLVRTANNEIIAHGCTGILVDSSDLFPLANAIDGLFSDPVLRGRIGSAASERASNSYSWNRAGARFVDFIESHIAGSTRPIPHSEFRIPQIPEPQWAS